MSLHPVFAQALAPFAPPQSSVHAGDGINDDDIYIVDVRTKRIIERHGCKSVVAQSARFGDMPVEIGQALLTGMQARHFGAKA